MATNTRRPAPEGSETEGLEEPIHFACIPLISPCMSRHIDEATTFASTDFRNMVPRFSPENRKASQAMVELLGRIAKRKKAAAAQVAVQGARYAEAAQRLVNR